MSGSMVKGSSWAEVNVGFGPVLTSLFAVIAVVVNLIERKCFERILMLLEHVDKKVWNFMKIN
jgi:hypothetical protein